MTMMYYQHVEEIGRGKHQSSDRRKRIDQMLLDGHSVSEIVATVGCSPATVTARRKALGITRRRNNVDPEKMDEARRLYEQKGLTIHAIMRRTGIAHWTIDKALKDQGWQRQVEEVRQGRYVPPDNLLEIWQGLPRRTTIALADQLGIARSTAYNLAVEYDLPGRRTNESSLADYADDIRRWYTDEGLTDALIAQRLGEQYDLPITDGAVTLFRIKTLGIRSDRRRKVGRYSVAHRLEQASDEELARQFAETEQEFDARGAVRRTKSTERLAQRYGVSQARMHRELKKRGLLADRFSFAGDAARIHDLFQRGLTAPKIARELGCSDEFVRSCLHQLGVELGHHVQRMTKEEHRQWRISIRQGRARSDKEGGRYVHPRTGIPMDSTYEIRFVDYCDRYGLAWERFRRTEESLLPVDLGGDLDTLYGPDFWVTYSGERVLVEIKGIYGADDAIKVAAWRAERGELSLLTQNELSDFFVAKTAQEAFDIVKAGAMCFPSIRKIARNTK